MQISILKSEKMKKDSINDFEIELRRWNWDGSIEYGSRVFSPDTEFGGIVREISTDTDVNVIRAKGDTWRGMMTKRLYSRQPDRIMR